MSYYVILATPINYPSVYKAFLIDQDMLGGSLFVFATYIIFKRTQMQYACIAIQSISPIVIP